MLVWRSVGFSACISTLGRCFKTSSGCAPSMSRSAWYDCAVQLREALSNECMPRKHRLRHLKLAVVAIVFCMVDTGDTGGLLVGFIGGCLATLVNIVRRATVCAVFFIAASSSWIWPFAALRWSENRCTWYCETPFIRTQVSLSLAIHGCRKKRMSHLRMVRHQPASEYLSNPLNSQFRSSQLCQTPTLLRYSPAHKWSCAYICRRRFG